MPDNYRIISMDGQLKNYRYVRSITEISEDGEHNTIVQGTNDFMNPVWETIDREADNA